MGKMMGLAIILDAGVWKRYDMPRRVRGTVRTRRGSQRQKEKRQWQSEQAQS